LCRLFAAINFNSTTRNGRFKSKKGCLTYFVIDCRVLPMMTLTIDLKKLKVLR
jgi:hypothetical protein